MLLVKLTKRRVRSQLPSVKLTSSPEAIFRPTTSPNQHYSKGLCFLWIILEVQFKGFSDANILFCQKHSSQGTGNSEHMVIQLDLPEEAMLFEKALNRILAAKN